MITTALQFFKIYLLALAALALLLIGWKFGYSVSCLAGVFPVITLVVMSYGYIIDKLQERACLRVCYFKQNSLIANLLLSKKWVVVWKMLLAVIMTTALMAGLLDYELILWLYLLLHLMVVCGTFLWLGVVFKPMLNEEYLMIFVARWTYRLSGLLLVVVFIVLQLNFYHYPSYLSGSLEQTISQASALFHSNCELIDYVVRIKAESDALFWWLMANESTVVGNNWLNIFMWGLFVLTNALALLGLNHLIVQVVSMVVQIVAANGKSNTV